MLLFSCEFTYLIYVIICYYMLLSSTRYPCQVRWNIRGFPIKSYEFNICSFMQLERVILPTMIYTLSFLKQVN